MDVWGIKKIVSFYDRELEIICNNEVVFKRENPKSFKIGNSFFTKIWNCDVECYTKYANTKKSPRACCKHIQDDVVITGGNFSKNKRSSIEYTYPITVNGKEIPIEEMVLRNPPCPYFSNNLCTVNFPKSKEEFYKAAPLICVTTPGMFIQNRDNNIILMRNSCTRKKEKIPYDLERWTLDKIVIKRFYDFYAKYKLKTDYTFLHLLENTDYPFQK